MPSLGLVKAVTVDLAEGILGSRLKRKRAGLVRVGRVDDTERL